MPALPGRLESQDEGEGMKPGIHQKVPMAQYLALAAVSASLLNRVLDYSPFHAKHAQDNPEDDPTTESETGTAIHDALLEGRDRIVAVDAPDWRTKAAKEQREFVRQQGGIPMLAHKVAQVEAAMKAAKQYVAGSEIAGVFDTGAPEQTLIAQEDGLLLKARPDWLTADRSILLHVKTTKGSANPETWIRTQLSGMGYDVAALFYERVLAAAAPGERPPLSVFLVIEQEPPHGCSLVGLDPAMQDIASRKVERALRLWANCVTAQRWPAYPSQIAYAEPRQWQILEEQMRQQFPEETLKGGIPL